MNEHYAIRVITAPPYEPLSREETKLHLRVDSDLTADDGLIDGLIVAARQWCESYTGRALINQVLEVSYDEYPCDGVFRLPRSPVISIDSIKYTDWNGDEQTWGASNYQVDIYSEPARITLAWLGLLPSSLRRQMNTWRVQFTAGYPAGSPTGADAYRENVPRALKQAMLLVIAHLYENREAVDVPMNRTQPSEVPLGAVWLASPYRVEFL